MWRGGGLPGFGRVGGGEGWWGLGPEGLDSRRRPRGRRLGARLGGWRGLRPDSNRGGLPSGLDLGAVGPGPRAGSYGRRRLADGAPGFGPAAFGGPRAGLFPVAGLGSRVHQQDPHGDLGG
ncbi:MAG: hypothetical protein Kow0092_36010 [Deferrisomatales bacterium]